MEDFSSCEISDALVKLGSKHGGYLPDIHCVSPGTASAIRVAGPAYTVKMVLFDDEIAPKPAAHFVDTAKEDHIILIHAPAEVKSAVWGGLMSYGARARGAKAVVISGRCRDIMEHREAGFPVFARGQSTLGQKPFTRPSEINVPLKFSPSELEQNPGASGSKEGWPSVLVRPGDWIVADQDGVVVVPLEIMERVNNVCRKGREVDEACKAAIIAGEGVAATFKKYRGK